MNQATEQLFDAVQNNNLNNGAKFLVRNGADVNANIFLLTIFYSPFKSANIRSI
ncbi:hypothetical protein NOX90_03725 [Wolbachia endosymbiont of Anurida maritima]|uniref:hypothetical protein n=1 Tax=Wolbachia endosymbiont of Anurida maritima TaxID=2850562 RepID=UPI0035D09649